MVKDNSDSERENLLPPHGLLFPIFYMHIPQHIPRALLHQSWNTDWNGTRHSILPHLTDVVGVVVYWGFSLFSFFLVTIAIAFVSESILLCGFVLLIYVNTIRSTNCIPGVSSYPVTGR